MPLRPPALTTVHFENAPQHKPQSTQSITRQRLKIERSFLRLGLFFSALAATLLISLIFLSHQAAAQEKASSIDSSLSAPALKSVTLENRPTYFSRPLDLVNVRVPNNAEFRSSDYLFTLDIPSEAALPLQTVVFSQIEGADYPRYSERRTYAYENGDHQAALNLTVTDSARDRTVTVVFDPPVQPGRQVTIALNARRNPRDGIYIYEIMGTPPNVDGPGQRIGIGRLQFYERADRFYRGFR